MSDADLQKQIKANEIAMQKALNGDFTTISSNDEDEDAAIEAEYLAMLGEVQQEEENNAPPPPAYSPRNNQPLQNHTAEASYQDSENLEVTEEDLNDPEMLAQLKELGYVDDEEPKPPAPSPTAPSQNIADQIMQHKKAALAAKRSGNMTLAKQHLQKYKTLQKQQKQTQQKTTLSSTTPKPTPTPTRKTKRQPEPTETRTGQALITGLMQEIKQVKKEVQIAKQNGNAQEVAECMELFHRLQKRYQTALKNPNSIPIRTDVDTDQDPHQSKKTKVEQETKMEHSVKKLEKMIEFETEKGNALKMKSLNAKRDNDMATAKTLFMQFKQSKATVQELKSQLEIAQKNSNDVNDDDDIEENNEAIFSSSIDVNEDEAENVELTEEDMNDPELQAALQAMNGETVQKKQQQQKEEENTVADNDEDNDSSSNNFGSENEIQEMQNELQELDIKIRNMKINVVSAKKEKRMGEAKELFAQYKEEVVNRNELKQLIDEYIAEQGQEQEQQKKEEQDEPTQKSEPILKPKSNEKQTDVSETTTTSKTSKPEPKAKQKDVSETTTPGTTSETRDELMHEIKKYQKLALDSKKNKDVAATKSYFAKYKELQLQLQNTPLPPTTLTTPGTTSRLDTLRCQASSFRASALNFKKNNDLISAKEELEKYKLIKIQIENLQLRGDDGMQSKTTAQKKINARKQKLDQLELIVTKELTHIQKVITHAIASRDLKLIEILNAAIERCRKQKATILMLRSTPERKVPVGNSRTVLDRLVLINQDVSQDILLMTIHRFENGIYKKDKNRSVNLFIKYDFGYPRKDPVIGQTEMKTNSIQMVSYEKFVRIPLPNGRLSAKATLRHFEKKKISFEICHQQQHMFSNTNVVIGKAEIELKTLLTKSSMVQMKLPILDPEIRRKKIDGHLVVSLKLREPLQGQDVREIKRTMLVLSSGSTKGNGKKK